MASSIQPRPPATSDRRWGEVTSGGQSRKATRRAGTGAGWRAAVLVPVFVEEGAAIARDYGRRARLSKYFISKRFPSRTTGGSEPGRIAGRAVGAGVLAPQVALREQDVVLVVERVHLLH